MSKFLKSLFLLLTAGVFTTSGWAVLPEPWAEWTSFTSDKQSPTISKTINNKNGGNWEMNKSGGTRSDGLITTTVGANSPYIDLMNDSADFGSNANPITLVATIKLSETASSNSVQPLIVFDSWKASTTRALTLDLCGENGATFGAAKMQHDQNNYSIDNYDKEEETVTVSEIKPGVEVQIALFLSSEGLKLYTVSNNSATLRKTWANVTVASAETGRITFGGAHNAEAKVAFTLKNVAIYPNPDATIPLDFSAATKTAATITGDVNANAIEWNPSAPTNVVDATLTVSRAAQLTMNADVTAHKLEVTGADLTIATDGSHKLTAAQTTIRANTIIEANAVSLGTVYIPAGVTLTVNDANAVTSVTGAGTLFCEGFLLATDTQRSALVTSVMNATTWGGTVALKGKKDFTNLDLDEYGNSTSVIELNGLGNGTNQTYMRHTQTIVSDVVLTGENWFTDGSSSATITFSGDISGDGAFKFKKYNGSSNPSETWVFNGAYTTSIVNENVTNRKIIFGPNSNGAEQGYIVVAKSVTIEDGKVWQAPKGVKVTSTGVIAGAGSLTSTEQGAFALTLAEGATIDTTAGVLTANTLAALPSALTVKVANALAVGDTLDILTTTAPPNTASTTVTVMVGDSMAEGAYSLKATDTSLQLVRNEVRSTVEVNVSEDSSALSSALNGAVLAKNATLTIHFTANDQTFTFDNALGVTLRSLTVTAKDGVTGGTIVKTGAGAVTATMTNIDVSTTIIGSLNLGAVTIAENMQLTVPSATTFTGMTTAASSILEMAGDADFTQAGAVDIFGTFIGTYKVGTGTTTKLPSASSDGDANTKGNYIVGERATLDLNGRLADETSTITLCNGATLTSSATVGYEYNWKSWPYIHLYDANTTATISGKTFSTVNSGNGAHTYYLRGGTLEFALASNETFKASSLTFLKESGSTEPAGTIKVKSGTLEFGQKDASAANVAVVLNGGKIEVDTNYAFGALGGTGGQLEVAANKQLTIGALAQTSSYAGVISGTGAVNVTGGELTLSGVNTNTGALNINGAKVSMTGSWAGAVTVRGTITGDGSIGGSLTMANDAIVIAPSAAEQALTVTDMVTLPAAMTVKITEAQDVNGTITLLNAANVTIPEGQVVTVMVDKTEGLNDYAVTHEDGVLKLTVAERVQEVTATVPTRGSLNYSDVIASVDGVLADDFTLTIDFGNMAEGGTAEPGTFTFNNADNVTLANVVIQGTNGGTITKTGAGTVTATATTIKAGCTVTVSANTAVLGAVAIESGANLTLTGNSTASTIAGAGSLTVKNATLTVNSASSYAGIISVLGQVETAGANAKYATLYLTESLVLAEGAKLMVGANGSLRNALTDKELVVTINEGATLMRNTGILSTNVILNSGAILDYTEVREGESSVLDVTGCITLVATQGAPIILKGLPKDYVGTFLTCYNETWQGGEKKLFVFQDANGTEITPDNRFTTALNGVEIVKAMLGLTKLADDESITGIPEAILDEICGVALGDGCDDISEIDDSNIAECFTGYALLPEREEVGMPYKLTICATFGIGDVRVLNRIGNNGTTEQVAIALMVTNGAWWDEKPAYLHEGTEIYFSTDGKLRTDKTKQWCEDAAVPLTGDELVAAGLATEATKADVYAGKLGVYWYWAGDLPTIEEGKTSATLKYDVKAVNNSTSSQQ